MLSSVNLECEEAIYVQVKNQILFAIASGALKPGDLIPTVSAVAEATAVNVNTVAKAYRDLEVMGLVKARRGRGFFVLDAAAEICRERIIPAVIGRLHIRVAEALMAGIAPSDIAEIARLSIESQSMPYAPLPATLEKATKTIARKTIK